MFYQDPQRRAGRLQAERGKTILILGVAGDGPVLDPRQPKDVAEARAIFGDPADGDLLLAYEQAYSLFPDMSYVLVRINGAHASASVELEGIALEARAWGGGTAYNGIVIESDGVALSVRRPDGVGRSYDLSEFGTLGELCSFIGAEAEAGLCPIVLSASSATFPVKDLGSFSMTLDGGEDRLYLTVDERFLALQEAYSLLEGFVFDVVCPLGAYFDTPSLARAYQTGNYGQVHYGPEVEALTLVDSWGKPARFHSQLLEFLRYSRQGPMIPHGVMSLYPRLEEGAYLDLAGQLRVEGTLLTREGFLAQGDRGMIDEGGLLSIIAQGVMVGGRWVSLAPVYAALWCQDRLSLTNAPAPIQGEIVPVLTGSELKELADLGVAGFAFSPRHGWVVAYGVTAAPEGDRWRNADNMRAVQKTLHDMNAVLDQEVGRGGQWAIRRYELEKELKEILSRRKQAGFIKDASVEVGVDTPEIRLAFIPRQTTQAITARGSLGSI